MFDDTQVSVYATMFHTSRDISTVTYACVSLGAQFNRAEIADLLGISVDEVENFFSFSMGEFRPVKHLPTILGDITEEPEIQEIAYWAHMYFLSTSGVFKRLCAYRLRDLLLPTTFCQIFNCSSVQELLYLVNDPENLHTDLSSFTTRDIFACTADLEDSATLLAYNGGQAIGVSVCLKELVKFCTVEEIQQMLGISESQVRSYLNLRLKFDFRKKCFVTCFNETD